MPEIFAAIEGADHRARREAWWTAALVWQQKLPSLDTILHGSESRDKSDRMTPQQMKAALKAWAASTNAGYDARAKHRAAREKERIERQQSKAAARAKRKAEHGG
jgi:hypothetical protein